jgi:uncharacterized tellurite resistance protein B-like protein
MRQPSTLESLDRTERLQLLRFVASFAWADLTISDAERTFVHQLVRRLELSRDEAEMVESWLKVPPPPDSVDPTHVPHNHRRVFIDTVRAMVQADGNVSEEERESLELLEQLTQ